MSWPRVKVESIKADARYSLVGGPFGSNLTTRDYVDDGVPVIRGGNLPDEKSFNDDDFVFVREEKADQLIANNAYPGDVVFTQRGTLGQVGLIPVDSRFSRYLISQSQMKLTVDPGKADAKFVYYYFRDPDTVQNIKNHAITSGVPHINLGLLREFEISLPPVDAQRDIVAILSAYDDLIENNRRRMALLEESARLRYREWFVRLHFPGHEHTRIVNGVPEGWERKTLGDTCSEIHETVSPESIEPDTPYIGLEHIPRRSISLCDWATAETVTSTKHGYKETDVVFGKIRPYFHKVGIAFTDGVASSDAIVIRANSDDLRGFVLLTVSSDEFVAQASQTMREGSKMPRADWKLMTQYRLTLPPQWLRGAFAETAAAITDQLRNLCFQNRNLKAARDLLLPRLMSGEIVV
jgi:type I restriction enzyme, S subunit